MRSRPGQQGGQQQRKGEPDAYMDWDDNTRCRLRTLRPEGVSLLKKNKPIAGNPLIYCNNASKFGVAYTDKKIVL